MHVHINRQRITIKTLIFLLIPITGLACPFQIVDPKVDAGDLQKEAKRQLKMQENKVMSRTLNRYDALVFRSNGFWAKSQTPGVREYLLSWMGHDSAPVRCEHRERDNEMPFGLDALLNHLYELRHRQIHWSDWGSGYRAAQETLAIKRFKKDKSDARKLRMTAVDLIAWKAEYPHESQLPWYELKAKNEGKEILKPQLILADMTTIQLSVPADLITIIESMHYPRDKLRMIVNAYNQLADGGFLIMASDSYWARELIVKSTENPPKNPEDKFAVIGELVRNLRAGGVEVITSLSDPDTLRADDARILLIVKRPGTKLRLKARLVATETTEEGTDAVWAYYNCAKDVVQVEDASSPIATIPADYPHLDTVPDTFLPQTPRWIPL